MGRTRHDSGQPEPVAGLPGADTEGTESAAEAPGPKPQHEPFEASTARLAAIVAQLESGELPLEESLRLFEEGVKVARAAQKRLDEAEQRVEELLGTGEDGEAVTRDFDGQE